MQLSPSEKQTLIGPLVVGCLLGVFAAYCVFAFAGEYNPQGLVESWWSVMAEATLAFFVSVLATVGVLGVVPVVLHRGSSKGKGDV